jgi:hypothetical protein
MIDLAPKYTGGECGEQTRASADIARRVIFRERDAYGILHFIMRRIYLLGVNDRQES